MLGDVQGTAFVQAFNLLDHDHFGQPEGDSYGLIRMGGSRSAGEGAACQLSPSPH